VLGVVTMEMVGTGWGLYIGDGSAWVGERGRERGVVVARSYIHGQIWNKLRINCSI
jgi:hypothetical protein